ncbi:MAG: Glycine hydroxymethyltransferase [Thermomicrobiales bacterium]|jgi:glycine hydroxymethyltransferase|nr:Glycine hydroxymethyltransferase [Thermomicrobiales bacterium]MDF3037883.1 Glycine hydroxymethyltransferase [Thermomicrobiales bacterium]
MLDLSTPLQADPEVAAAVGREEGRQRDGVELIASENFVSPAVLEAVGSVLTNKYAEGYPGKRYYGGCEFVDEVERLAIDRAKRLFGADHANVQPHSGSNANMAAYLALLEPGDRILGLSLAEGGHLTHGHAVNFSGRLFEPHFFGVDFETGLIDYDNVLARAKEVRPKGIIAGASAYSRQMDYARFRAIADEVGALLFADIAHPAGLVATGLHPSPIPHAHVTMTTTHKTLRGPRGGMLLCGDERAKAIDKSVFPGLQGGPLMHVIAGKAVALGESLSPQFADYSARVIDNARAMASALSDRGLPIISGGTDTHLMLVDVGSQGLSGSKAEKLLDAVGITCNKNTIPGDTRSPAQASGIRLGTPAVTTRGFGQDDCRVVAGYIADVLEAPDDETRRQRIGGEVREMMTRFPLPGVN